MKDVPRDPYTLFNVRGKVAVVTGASGAFGAVAARTLAGAGAKLVLAAGKVDELSDVASQCKDLGAEVECVNLRPNNETDCASIVKAAVKRFGGIDILIVASGMNDPCPNVDMSPERFGKVMEANVTGSFLMAQAAGRQMIAQGTGGKVVLMSSVRGLLGHPGGYSAYCCSKAAVDGITKALGCEWAKHNITVNAIAPTVFRSALTAWMFADDEKGTTVRNGMLARIPVGRLGEPADLSGPLLFLVSPASDFYTGHILYADGGYTAG
jgi:NAD(P)-dependent dehydrogenase (short-subunit alcohol dehydrogenase family)